MDRKRGFFLKIISITTVLFLLMIFATTVGSVKVPIRDTVRIIASEIVYIAESIVTRDEVYIGERVSLDNVRKQHIFIVKNIRLPRIVLASLVGAVLALVGTSYQAIFKNPMADPFVMGVSSGAAFGATLGIVLGLNVGVFAMGTTAILAFIGALLTTAIVYNLARVGNKISTTSILLAGIVMSSLLSAGISLMMIFNQDDLSKIVGWTMGSFNAANWDQVALLLVPTLIGLVVLVALSREMNAIVLGEESAQNIGVNVEIVKKIIIVVASLLAAIAVSVSGIIGFVGLMVPHLFRLIVGSNHKKLLPVSVLGGAIFLLICDTIARSALEGMDIPVGIITSIIGGPYFLYLLKKTRKNKLI